MIWTKALVARKTMASAKNLFLRRLLMPIKIQRFNFEVTRKCSGKCRYCNVYKSNPSNELTVQEVCDGLQPRSLFKSVEQVAITGGEPFLRKDLVNLCFELKQAFPKASVGMVTNGLHPCLVLERMKEIREFCPEVSIGISIDGYKDMDNYLRGNPQHHDLAWTTYHLLKDNGFRPSVGSSVTHLNLKELVGFRRFCMAQKVPHAFHVVATSEHYYDNVGEIDDLMLTNEDLPLFDELCRIGQRTAFNYYFPKYMREKRQIMPCFSGFNSFFLNAQGTVYPCIHLNQPFGNIRKQPFGSFWNGEDSKHIREGIVKGQCHCWTICEVQSWFHANILPAVTKKLKQKLLGG